MEKNVYSRAKISARGLEVVIFLGLLAILLVTVYLSVTGGFEIRFESSGGTAVESQRLRYGEAIVEPAAPEREGYVFVGWYADEGLSERMDFENATAERSTTVYAKWETDSAN